MPPRQARPTRKQRSPRNATKQETAPTYGRLSAGPVHTLLFLAPLLLLYELGSALFLTRPGSGVVETVKAHKLLSDFFRLFGAAGFHLPALALVAALLAQQRLTRDPWRPQKWVLGGMLAESAAWTAPLLLLSGLSQRLAAAVASAPQTPLASLSIPAKITIAIGAGLYEELVFRMLAIALLHLILVDLLKAREAPGRVAAVVLAAAAFALYHDTAFTSGLNLPLLGFYFAAGLYFGALYAWRGFGIVVGAHALYDIAALLLPR
ncbi:MAG: CPBP family intramembrane metalloprotease [Planctomycetota bacterium]|nr:MAG: CPBP family intramembrane metalloprotease [Planctomycetota bacterium]